MKIGLMKRGESNRGGSPQKVLVQQLFIPFPLFIPFIFLQIYDFLCCISVSLTILFPDELSIQFLFITTRFKQHNLKMPEHAKVTGDTTETIQRCLKFWKFYCTQKGRVRKRQDSCRKESVQTLDEIMLSAYITHAHLKMHLNPFQMRYYHTP